MSLMSLMSMSHYDIYSIYQYFQSLLMCCHLIQTQHGCHQERRQQNVHWMNVPSALPHTPLPPHLVLESPVKRLEKNRGPDLTLTGKDRKSRNRYRLLTAVWLTVYIIFYFILTGFQPVKTG
jgi:hypothetical protein